MPRRAQESCAPGPQPETPDALMDRVENSNGLEPGERLVEGAAVLAGTVLMAAGVSG